MSDVRCLPAWRGTWLLVVVWVAGCQNLAPKTDTVYKVPEVESAPLGAQPDPAGRGGSSLTVAPPAASKPAPASVAPSDTDSRAVAAVPSLAAPKAEPVTPRIEPDGVHVARKLDLSVKAPARKQVNGHATYRLTLRNSGDAPADEVTVHCDFDQRLEFPGKSERTVVQRLGLLSPGEVKELSLSLTSRETGTHCCRFSVTSREAGRETEAVWKSVCVEFVPRQLEIEVRGPVQRTVGSRAEFNIHVSNYSDKAIANVQAALNFDAALVPEEVTTGAEQKSGRLLWNLGELQAHEGVQLQVEFDCRLPAHRACLQAEAFGAGLADEQRELCVEIVPVPGVLDLRVSDRTDPLTVGAVGDFETTVQNIGLQPARRVQVEFAASSNLKIESATVKLGDRALSVKSHPHDGKIVFDPIDELPPDGRLTFVIQARGVQEGAAEFTATLRSALSQIALSTTETTSVTAP